MPDVDYHRRTHDPNGTDPIAGTYELKVWPDETVAVILDIDALEAGNGMFIFPILDDELHLTRLVGARAKSMSGGGCSLMIRNVTQASDLLLSALADDGSDAEIDGTGTPATNRVELLDDIAIDVDDAGTDTFGLVVMLKFSV